MKKIVTFALVAGGALALAACGAKKEEAPAETVVAEPMVAETIAPVEPTDAATDAAAMAAEELDPTGNPIKPRGNAADAPAAGAAPTAE